MTLADFTSHGLIAPDLRSREVPDVLQELSQLLHREGRIPSLLAFYHAALNREYLLSTDAGGPAAFPHARLVGLGTLSFAIGRSSVPLVWRPGGTSSVQLVFLLAVPATDSTDYLRVMSALARLTTDPDRLRQLLTAAEPGQILALLAATALRSDPPRTLAPEPPSARRSPSTS
jgi:mannitol/fructose-specific phosphotransferase system IIA component (Ntr-type)